VLAAPKGVRKAELVRPYFEQLGAHEGIACVLTSLETSRTFSSSTPQRTPLSGDTPYRRSGTGRKRIVHLDGYGWDPIRGPLSVRVATYRPFTIGCYRNGHPFVSQRLRAAGVAVEQPDNAIVRVGAPVALQAAADALPPAVLQARCEYWAAKVAPQFSPTERARLTLLWRHRSRRAGTTNLCG